MTSSLDPEVRQAVFNQATEVFRYWKSRSVALRFRDHAEFTLERHFALIERLIDEELKHD